MSSPAHGKKRADAVAVKPQRRLKGEARVETILKAAAKLFADEGLSGTTRQIATKLGRTQALLYKYFPSKEALIDQVYETHFTNRWNSDWDGLLADEDQPLEARLVRFYNAYAGRADATTIRLFIRAGLAGRPLPGARGAKLTDQIFVPVIAALRHTVGLPTFVERPMMRGERELCMQLHSSIVFLGIRRHVYRMPMPDNLSDVIELYVKCFIAGAPSALQALHADSGVLPSLQVRQLSPGRRKPRRDSR